MGCKIRKEYSSEGGNNSYFIVTGDYSSLEAKCAAIDTYLNPVGQDPLLKSIYEAGSKISDLHSVTGHSLFCDSLKQKGVHVTDENGKNWAFLPTSKIKIKRKNDTLIIQAEELVETDEIIDFA
jgi:hypothetical protein